MVKLTSKASAVCAANWGKRGSGCEKCPIHQVCAQRIPAGEAALDAYTAQVNAAAEQVPA